MTVRRLACQLLVMAAPAAAGLLAAPGALADTFAAAPDATRAQLPCSIDTPCALAFAVTQPTTDADLVQLADGAYTVDQPLMQAYGTLAPAPGAHPVLSGTGMLRVVGVTVRDLTFHTTGTIALGLAHTAIGERLRVDHEGGTAGIQVDDGATLRDSVVVQHGAATAAVVVGAGAGPTSAVVENVTAMAVDAGGVGVDVVAPGGAVTCDPSPDGARIRNVIARGDTVDIRARVADPAPDTCAGATATADVAASNFRTATAVDDPGGLVLGDGNQTLPVQTALTTLFADADERQQPTSPTIDAGVADAWTGTADPDGDARTLGGRPDIGADEMIAAPVVTTGAAQLLGVDAARLTASAGAPSPFTVRFDVGTDTNYGTTLGGGSVGDDQYAADAVGVPVGTLLHYRAVATASNGLQSRSTFGADSTVLVPVPPLPTPIVLVQPPPTSPPASASVQAPLNSASVVQVTAPARSCSSRRTITLRLKAPKGGAVKKVLVTLRGKTTTYTGKHLKARIDLRGLPKGTFSVKIAITLRDGRTARLTRTYQTCVSG